MTCITISPDYANLFLCTSPSENYVLNIEIASGNITQIHSNLLYNPKYLGITPDGTRVLVLNTNQTISCINLISNEVSLIDANGFNLTALFALTINPSGNRAFVLGNQTLYELDIAQGKIIKSLLLRAQNSPLTYSMSLNVSGTKIYICNAYDQTVSVIDSEHLEWLYDINNFESLGGIGPNRVACSPNVKDAFVDAAAVDFKQQIFGYVQSFNLRKGSIAQPKQTPYTSNSLMRGLAFNRSGSRAYVCDQGNACVVEISSSANTVTKIIQGFDGKPSFIAITPIPCPMSSFQVSSALEWLAPFKYQKGL